MNSKGLQILGKSLMVALATILMSIQFADWALLEIGSKSKLEVVQDNSFSDEEEKGIAGETTLSAPNEAIVTPLKASLSPIILITILVVLVVPKTTYANFRIPDYSVTSFQKLFRTSIFPKAP